jgi:23S rRNA pseudouridine2605 synthase
VERLQKILAAGGVASRRAAEALIRAGRVTVNGRVVRELGARADPDHDAVAVDGRVVTRPATFTYLVLHKPRGYTTTVADPHARHTVMEFLRPGTPRVFPVGRLDRDSEGLLLLTDDGALTVRLLHPRYRVPKEYAVLVRGGVTEAVLRRLREGVPLAEGRAAPAAVELGAPPAHLHGAQGPSGAGETRWLRVVLHEGRKRQIRAMCAAVGLQVQRLVRTRIGPLTLRRLRPGRLRPLTDAEVARLRRACGLPAGAGPARAAQAPVSRTRPAPPERTTRSRTSPPRPRPVRAPPRADHHPRPPPRSPRPDGGRPAEAHGQSGRPGRATPPRRQPRVPAGRARPGAGRRAGGAAGRRAAVSRRGGGG